MGDLSKHFNLAEFVCHCGCKSVFIHDELIDVLEGAREHFGSPIKITSGTRCKVHNMASGGAKNSQHLYGIAADIQVDNHNPAEVADYFERLYPEKYGIGRYNSWTHIDIRPEKARWNLAKVH